MEETKIDRKSNSMYAPEFIENHLIVEGKSEQENWEQINFLPDTSGGKPNTMRGVTFTKQPNGSYAVTGQNDGTGQSTRILCENYILKAGTYYFMPSDIYNDVWIVLCHKIADGSTVYRNYTGSGKVIFDEDVYRGISLEGLKKMYEDLKEIVKEEK